MPEPPVDALLLVSFGGPEGPDDVLPFLRNVTRGRGVPPQRLAEVAEHYRHFGGVSPINAQNRALRAAIEADLGAAGLNLPVYWGNRNWHPYLADTVRQMTADGVRRALAFVTSAYSSYSSCRQYQEDIAAARSAVGGAAAPRIDKLRHYYNAPGFIEALVRSTTAALGRLPADERAGAHLVFVAHSIPTSMAASSGPTGDAYPTQLTEASRLVADGVGGPPWELAYSSRSGPATSPWLEPDIGDHLAALADRGVTAVVAVPIGFVSDHMEVIYDLDVEARARADSLGLRLVRAATVGTDPDFVATVRELVLERAGVTRPRRALGRLGPSHDVCPLDCCPAPARRAATEVTHCAAAT